MAGRSASDVLRQFDLLGVLDTGNTIGDGSYATVKELDFRGLKCVGKKIHDILYNSASPQVKSGMLDRFAIECELLSRLRHPCIVQFLGVILEQGSQLPVLVMEYLHTTLADCLDQSLLPEAIMYGILRDVALGLRYLHEHSPPIVHRDLSANNVLLATNMSAKISDLGMAKILNLNPVQMGYMTQTQTPGTPCYMPPEAMVARPKYTNKVDVFSLGVMMVHILSGQWPIPGEAFRVDPNNPYGNVPVSEFDRRAEFLKGVRQDHPLMELIRRCLSNVQTHRPEAVGVHMRISTILASFSQSQLNLSTLLQEIDSMRKTPDTLRCVESGRVTTPRLAATSRLAHVQLVAEVQSHPPFHEAILGWRKCADLCMIPGMGVPQSVLMGRKVYVGGGATSPSDSDRYLVVHRDIERDGWFALPPCPVAYFGLGVFKGSLITVGGVSRTGGQITGNVYRYREKSHNWEEYLVPLAVPRMQLSLVTTESALVTCGGQIQSTGFEIVNTVEVYTTETSQWYIADPLPVPYAVMSSAIIGDTCYLLGGSDKPGNSNRIVCGVSLSVLIREATSPGRCTGDRSVWNTLPDTPLGHSSAVSVDGNLLAIGGITADSCISKAVHVFEPASNSWKKMRGDLLESVHSATAIALPGNKVLVCGGYATGKNKLKSVYLGSISYP